jgi:hypothetical protein
MPKDIAEHFREWQALRAKVIKAETAAEKKAASAETKLKGTGRRPQKPDGRSGTH